MIETGKIKRLRILGGFLADLNLTFDNGLNCVIGARGTGKTTLLEALRFGFHRPTETLNPEAAKLLRENLTVHPIKIEFELDSNPGLTYTLTKYFDGETLCEANDRKLESMPNFPISVFSTDEIEKIADDEDGTRKRKLLDGFEMEQLRQRRKTCDLLSGQLKQNATDILVLEADAEPLREVVQELPLLEQKLTGLIAATEQMSNEELKWEQSLFSLRRKEKRFADSIVENLSETHESLSNEIEAVEQVMNELSIAKPESEVNKTLIDGMAAEGSNTFRSALSGLMTVATDVSNRIAEIEQLSSKLYTAHEEQQIRYEKLRESNMAISAKLKEKEDTQQRIDANKKDALRLEEIVSDLVRLRQERSDLRSQLYSERESISVIREGIASSITKGSIEDAHSGTPPVIQVHIIRRGDRSHFKELLQGALQGSKLRYGQMVESFSASFLPGEFADVVRQKDSERLAKAGEIDAARAESVIQHLSNQPEFLYELDSLWLDDKVEIKLNVADLNGALPEYKEAAELSTGQKCTAVLPIILMAESSGPLLIDQPENNLDNHYIFTDVVPRLEAIKGNRQLIFITHNPNIPVLAEAERIAVLQTEASGDGVKGKLKRVGTVEEVREEIISLLEGGREAFQLRAQKYGT